MVEDNSGLGYKFQSSRRKGSSGNRVTWEKVEKCKVLLKQGFCWVHEKRWWVVIISGVSLVIISVSILMIQKSQTPINLFLGVSFGTSLLAFSWFFLHRWRRWSRPSWSTRGEETRGKGGREWRIFVASIFRKRGQPVARFRNCRLLGQYPTSGSVQPRTLPPPLSRFWLSPLLPRCCRALQTALVFDKVQHNPRHTWTYPDINPGGLLLLIDKDHPGFWDDQWPRHK